ncbi:hypothetical protein AAFF_G00341230 [Aldrovandia affinis]|uniref:Uncharacterized protein n=1 Tax=Aldrovandia affinis TaxID=143900 RepID=A0AAD7SKZ7_9TELE|nr:hypothetical protein AAFF_G00341230 [Aldrovandia affinis]
MLLRPTVPGLCAMLQTIYETESCFSSDAVSSREQPLELLPRTRVSTAPNNAPPSWSRATVPASSSAKPGRHARRVPCQPPCHWF